MIGILLNERDLKPENVLLVPNGTVGLTGLVWPVP